MATNTTDFGERPKYTFIPSETSKGKGGKLELVYVTGDLFACPASDSLAHCVSEDLRMGKGIAVLFKKKFCGVDELKKQKCKVGEVAVLKKLTHYVYYLVTKSTYSSRPTYDTLEKSLQAMLKHCREKGVTRLAMPKIGCGLDGLEWGKVEVQLRYVFRDSGMTITVYSL